jgi:hypothetical protein
MMKQMPEKETETKEGLWGLFTWYAFNVDSPMSNKFQPSLLDIILAF